MEVKWRVPGGQVRGFLEIRWRFLEVRLVIFWSSGGGVLGGQLWGSWRSGRGGCSWRSGGDVLGGHLGGFLEFR